MRFGIRLTTLGPLQGAFALASANRFAGRQQAA